MTKVALGNKSIVVSSDDDAHAVEIKFNPDDGQGAPDDAHRYLLVTHRERDREGRLRPVEVATDLDEPTEVQAMLRRAIGCEFRASRAGRRRGADDLAVDIHNFGLVIWNRKTQRELAVIAFHHPDLRTKEPGSVLVAVAGRRAHILSGPPLTDWKRVQDYLAYDGITLDIGEPSARHEAVYRPYPVVPGIPNQ